MGAINLQSKIRELRDLINSSICYKQSAWDRKDDGDWSKLWTAVDNIEDTQSAVEEYLSLKNFSRLAVYGLLQAMYVQQDAIEHLEKAIQIQTPDWKKDYSGLSNIRDIRNETVGHPISKNGLYASISHTDNLNILEYGVWSKGGFQHKTINLKDIIQIQHDLLVTEINRVIKKIKGDEYIHKLKFQNQSLSVVLKTTSYNIQKLWPFERDRTYSKIMFESLCDAFERFKEEVKKRYGFNAFSEAVGIQGVVLTVEKIEKILPRVQKMLPMSSNVDPLDLEVYVESLSNAFDELRTMAKEIDEEFTNKV